MEGRGPGETDFLRWAEVLMRRRRRRLSRLPDEDSAGLDEVSSGAGAGGSAGAAGAAPEALSVKKRETVVVMIDGRTRKELGV